ncbi:unnamed protein product [Rotaria sp. Silwood1]|nr:unnamed protein product [Rotaria sp. Silwood1]CAF1180478.1 unnamed protein product [Rotaria sp. Silwood1]CAF3485349.1 unnamed protein product [Rotaria sp. Silwood1]CAF4973909.1 unnamed protein product [Rotaria sp. Silwood1]
MCAEIEQEHFKLKTNGVFKTFRGQQISVEELDRWKNNIGTIISINSFFSTSCNIETSLKFARSCMISNDMRSILLEVEIDSSLENVIWADISHRGHFKHEQEIIFNLNSLFKIVSVNFDSTFQLWKIQLKTTDEGTDNVEQYLSCIKQQMEYSSPIVYFGWLLLNELGQVNQAEKYFQMLLRSLPSDHPDIPSVYNGIGRVYSERNELDLALANYEMAYKLWRERLHSNPSHIARSLHNIANIMRDKGDFDQALNKYREALTIEEENHPDDNLQKAIIIQNIGNTLIEKGDLDTALDCLSRALDMLEHILPEQHPKISTCLGDIGSVYEKKNDFEKALDYYHKELDMDERCLPSDHPHLSRDLKKIVITYKKYEKVDQALEFCCQKLDLQRTIPGNNHSRIAKTLMNMATIIEEKSLNKAVRYYQEALSYLQKSTQIDHRTMAECLAAMGRLYGMHKSFDIALQYLLEALHLHHIFLSCNHLDVAYVNQLIGICYQNTNNKSNALHYFNESLSIYRATYGVDHEYVKLVESDVAKLNGEQQECINSTAPAEEIVHDEQSITIIVHSDLRESFIEPSSSTTVDSITMPSVDQKEMNDEIETPRKSKNCPKCEIL